MSVLWRLYIWRIRLLARLTVELHKVWFKMEDCTTNSEISTSKIDALNRWICNIWSSRGVSWSALTLSQLKYYPWFAIVAEKAVLQKIFIFVFFLLMKINDHEDYFFTFFLGWKVYKNRQDIGNKLASAGSKENKQYFPFDPNRSWIEISKMPN